MQVRHRDRKLERLEVDPNFFGGLARPLVEAFRSRMQLIRDALDERDFYALKSLHYEKLKGKRKHQRSMRLNKQFRLVLELEAVGSRTIVVITAIGGLSLTSGCPMAKTFKPAQAFPPGYFLREELSARGWTQGDLAKILGRPLQAVNEIINGKKRITAETAKALASALGTSAQLWLNMETTYQLAIAPDPDPAIKRRAAQVA